MHANVCVSVREKEREGSVCIYVRYECVRVCEGRKAGEAGGQRHAGGRGVLGKGQRCSAVSNVTEETTGEHTHTHTFTFSRTHTCTALHCCINKRPFQEENKNICWDKFT